jgi:hypothetical protein
MQLTIILREDVGSGVLGCSRRAPTPASMAAMETKLTVISMAAAVSISMVELTTEFMAAPRRV